MSSASLVVDVGERRGAGCWMALVANRVDWAEMVGEVVIPDSPLLIGSAIRNPNI